MEVCFSPILQVFNPPLPCATLVLQYHPSHYTLTSVCGTVVTYDWTTATIPLTSVVTFNTDINAMVDTLKTRSDLGYTFSPTLATRLTSCNMQTTHASLPTAQLLVSISWTWLTGGSNGQGWRPRFQNVTPLHCKAPPANSTIPPINFKPNHPLHWKQLDQVPWHDHASRLQLIWYC